MRPSSASTALCILIHISAYKAVCDLHRCRRRMRPTSASKPTETWSQWPCLRPPPATAQVRTWLGAAARQQPHAAVGCRRVAVVVRLDILASKHLD